MRSRKQARASGRAAELNRRADGASGQRNKHGVGGTASGERASLWLEKGGGRSFGLLAIALGQTVSRVRRAGNLPQKRASGNLLLFASWRLPRTKPGLTTFSLEFVSWLEWSLWQHWSAACSGPMLPQPVPTSLRSPFFRLEQWRGPINLACPGCRCLHYRVLGGQIAVQEAQVVADDSFYTMTRAVESVQKTPEIGDWRWHVDIGTGQ